MARASVRGCRHGWTDPALSDSARLAELEAALDQLTAEHRPDRVAVERLYFQRNVQTAMAVGQARGVALLVAARHGLPVTEPTPNEVKLPVCGNGAPTRQQVAVMVGRLLGVQAERHGRRCDRCSRRRDWRPGARPLASTPSARMIGSLRGPVSHIGVDFVLIDIGGVGYRVIVSPAPSSVAFASARRPRCSSHHLVRDDQEALFGFAKPEELAFFELLMTVNGVGPRLALAITGAHPVTRLQMAS